MITELNNSLLNIGYIDEDRENTLNIIYPIDYTEVEIMNLVNKLGELLKNPQNSITEIIIKNTEISVRLFLFLMEIINQYNICLYLPETVYKHYKIKKDKVLNLTKVNTDLIKVYHE